MKIDENSFYIGIGLDFDGGTISYLHARTQSPIMLDRTGGYGRIQVPMSMYYVEEEHLWLIGEEAEEMAQIGEGYIANSLTFLMEKKTVDLGNEHIDGYKLMAIFIEKLIHYQEQINPKAILKGLCLSYPDDINQESMGQVAKILSQKLDQEIIYQPKIITMLTYLDDQAYLKKGQTLMIDFGAKGLNVIEVSYSSAIRIKKIESTQNLSDESIQSRIKEILAQRYKVRTKDIDEHLEVQQALEQLVKTYYPYIMNQYKNGQGAKVTYNFTYPVFQEHLTYETLHQLMLPRIKLWCAVLEKIKHASRVRQVMLTGDGFKMSWLLEHLTSYGFIKKEVDSYLSCKGSALMSHPADIRKEIIYEDSLEKDFGFMLGTSGKESFRQVAIKGDSYHRSYPSILLAALPSKTKHVKLYSRDRENILQEVLKVPLPVSVKETFCLIEARVSFQSTDQPRLTLEKHRL